MRRLTTTAACLLLSAWIAAPAWAAERSRWDWATGPSIYDQEGKRDWRVEVAPYAWLASINGDIGVPAVGTIPVSATFSNLKDSLDGAFAGLLDIRYRRWHFISDNSWVRLKDSLDPDGALFTGGSIEATVAFGTVGIAYELPLNKSYSVDVLLGARWWYVFNDVTVSTSLPPGTFSGSIGEAWGDAVVGVRARYKITDRWRVSAQADIGGGEASLDWSLFVSGGYDFNDHVGLTLGYRILGVDYNKDQFLYDVTQGGLLLGINLRY